jgi:hypothetical protein
VDNDILKIILVAYLSLGVAFAFGELVELLVQRVICFFTKTECEYRGKIYYVYSILVIFLWPILVLSLILQIFFKKTYARIRLWIESKCLKYSKD